MPHVEVILSLNFKVHLLRQYGAAISYYWKENMYALI